MTPDQLIEQLQAEREKTRRKIELARNRQDGTTSGHKRKLKDLTTAQLKAECEAKHA
jgi:hypothetical protein